jgi:hypothetical protein
MTGRVSKIVVCVFVVKCVSIIVKYMLFVVKFRLPQISIILREFTHFIFTTINTYVHQKGTQYITKHTQFTKYTLVS